MTDLTPVTMPSEAAREHARGERLAAISPESGDLGIAVPPVERLFLGRPSAATALDKRRDLMGAWAQYIGTEGATIVALRRA